MMTVLPAVALAQVRSEKAPPDASRRQRVEVLFRNGPSPLHRLILAYRTGREPPR